MLKICQEIIPWVIEALWHYLCFFKYIQYTPTHSFICAILNLHYLIL